MLKSRINAFYIDRDLALATKFYPRLRKWYNRDLSNLHSREGQFIWDMETESMDLVDSDLYSMVQWINTI